MYRLWRIFWRSLLLEWRTICTKRSEQVMLVILPAIAVGFVWYSFSISQVRDLPIGVLDKDNTSLSRKLTQFVNASPAVEITTHYRNIKEIDLAMRTQDVYGVIIIPKGFSKRLRQVKPSPVTLKVNALYGTHSGIVQSGVGGAVRTFSAGVEINLRKKMGMSDAQAQASFMPIQPQGKMAFNMSLSYQRFLASEMIPSLLFTLASVVGAGVMGRELRYKRINTWFYGVCGYPKKTNKRIYGGVTRFFSMLVALNGKLFIHMIAYSFWMGITLALVCSENRTSLPSLLITSLNAWLMIALSLWIGVIATTLMMSKRVGLSLAGIITAPAFSYSGVTYPLAAMPIGAQYIAYALPLTHYLKLQIAQLQTDVGWQAAIPTTKNFIAVVAVMTVFASLLSMRAIRQRNRWGRR